MQYPPPFPQQSPEAGRFPRSRKKTIMCVLAIIIIAGVAGAIIFMTAYRPAAPPPEPEHSTPIAKFTIQGGHNGKFFAGDDIVLDGTASYDPKGYAIISYTWRISFVNTQDSNLSYNVTYYEQKVTMATIWAGVLYIELSVINEHYWRSATTSETVGIASGIEILNIDVKKYQVFLIDWKVNITVTLYTHSHSSITLYLVLRAPNLSDQENGWFSSSPPTERSFVAPTITFDLNDLDPKGILMVRATIMGSEAYSMITIP